MSPRERNDGIQTSELLDAVMSAASRDPSVNNKLLQTLTEPLRIAIKGVTLAGDALNKFKEIISPFAGMIGTAAGTAAGVVSHAAATVAPKAGEAIGSVVGGYLNKEGGAKSGGAIGKELGELVGKGVSAITPMVSEITANAVIDVVSTSAKQAGADPNVMNSASRAIFKELKGVNITGNDLKTLVNLGNRGKVTSELDTAPTFTPHASTKHTERKPAQSSAPETPSSTPRPRPGGRGGDSSS